MDSDPESYEEEEEEPLQTVEKKSARLRSRERVCEKAEECIEQARKHEMDDARLFDVTKYACNMWEELCLQFPGLCAAYSLSSIHEIIGTETVYHVLFDTGICSSPYG
jgi:hypothetical protein